MSDESENESEIKMLSNMFERSYHVGSQSVNGTKLLEARLDKIAQKDTS